MDIESDGDKHEQSRIREHVSAIPWRRGSDEDEDDDRVSVPALVSGPAKTRFVSGARDKI